ncbi:MAG: 4-hydroxythreonine-4-phosphate dehydrogenase PdxA [Bryobacterales bacterium]
MARGRLSGHPARDRRDARLPAIDPSSIVDVGGLESAEPGKLSAECGRAAVACIKTAAEMCVAGQARAMTTAPVNKEAVTLAGIPFTGHTEYIAEVTGAKESRMLLVSERLRVVHVTTRLVAQGLRRDAERIVRTIEPRGSPRAHGPAGRQDRGLRPEPHAGEHGLFRA